MIIDAHAHIGQGIYKQLTIDQLLRMMDEFEIDRAVVCPVDQFIILHNREGNDYILEAVRLHPDRFIGFAVANPWYERSAVDEARRAIDKGLRGLKFNSTLQAFFINDDIVYPLVELAGQLNVPIYFHTGTPIFSQPLQLFDIAEQYSEVRFIMGHAAASDFWIDALPAMQGTHNVFVETSLRSGSAVLQALIDEMGADRVMFGSDVPASDYGVELAKMRTLELSTEDREMVLGKTLLRVLR